MAESKPSRALHYDGLAPEVISAALGSSCGREPAPAPTSTVPPGYTLQFLIGLIKKSDRKIVPRV